MSAPKGWVLDNQSGAHQGLHAVFYPSGYSWQNSPVVAYSRIIDLDSKIRNIQDFVDDTLDDFHNHGSPNPNYKADFVKEIAANDRIAKLYYFSGDKWGNFEAGAYFQEEKAIAVIILHSKTHEAFVASINALEELVESYVFIANENRVKIESNS